jgi:hypothetical protein
MRSIILASTLFSATLGASNQCKTFPGDAAWPSSSEWNDFNKTINGRLVATVPLGAPCHGASFDSVACESLKSQWQTEEIQYV